MGKYANFYNSKNKDRVYDAESFSEWLRPFFKTGVFNGSLQVLSNQDMTVTIDPGYAYIDGKSKFFETPQVLTIESAHSTLKRIDNIVVRRNDIERDFTVLIQKGSFSANPSAPIPVRTGGIYDLIIAQINVEAAAPRITQLNVVDTRMDNELCGWVASNINEIPFEQLNAQFNAFKEQNLNDFNTWFNNIKNTLNGDVAGNLQNQVSTLQQQDEELQLQINANKLRPSTHTLLGGIMVGDELSITENGVLSVKPTVTINTTLLAGNWSGGGPFIYELEVNGVTETSNQDILPSNEITSEQYDAMSGAKVIGHHQETNKIVLKALGDKPSINIPIQVILRGNK